MKFSIVDTSKPELDFPSFPGVFMEPEYVGTSLKALTFYDEDGDIVLKLANDYGLTAMVPSPPKFEKKWNLAGTVLGLPVCEFFDSKYQADNRREELSGRLATEQFTLDVSEQDVEVPE